MSDEDHLRPADGANKQSSPCTCTCACTPASTNDAEVAIGSHSDAGASSRPDAENRTGEVHVGNADHVSSINHFLLVFNAM